jgi:hypothetical protein
MSSLQSVSAVILTSSRTVEVGPRKPQFRPPYWYVSPEEIPGIRKNDEVKSE